jgi:hypothetical protein
LGVDVSLRLAHLRDRRLRVPVDHPIPADLATVTDRDVRLDAIEAIRGDFYVAAQFGPEAGIQASAAYQPFAGLAFLQDESHIPSHRPCGWSRTSLP